MNSWLLEKEIPLYYFADHRNAVHTIDQENSTLQKR